VAIYVHPNTAYFDMVVDYNGDDGENTLGKDSLYLLGYYHSTEWNGKQGQVQPYGVESTPVFNALFTN
jgi:hypothetical protein